LVSLLLVCLTLTACRVPHIAPGDACSPPAGGRCAQDAGWRGPLLVTPDGRRLHQEIICGGVLHATETADQVTIRLHLDAMGPGTMSCARVDVGVRLETPLGDRTVVDAVSGRTVRVIPGSGSVHHLP
jgi:hypothetical protein